MPEVTTVGWFVVIATGFTGIVIMWMAIKAIRSSPDLVSRMPDPEVGFETGSVMQIGVFVLATIAYLFHKDSLLYISSVIIFYAAGVAWELDHWQRHQEFPNDKETAEE
jgi:hypothetical protein